MAVYTHLSAEELSELIAQYDVGTLVAAKGIAEGVSNSNWLIETTGKAESGLQQFILTMYERRTEIGDLPFFLGLLDHLSAKGCAVPQTIHDRDGASHRMIGNKAVALIEFLPGVSIGRPLPQHAHSVGSVLAGVHTAASDFNLSRANDLGAQCWAGMAAVFSSGELEQIDASLPDLVENELDFLSSNWPVDLPRGIIHADLFPDNVLILGDKVSGLIDFYFACTDLLAYDLAVTHAAWCFTPDGTSFDPDVSHSLIAGYDAARQLAEAEQASLHILARGACLRFLLTRADDWLNTPDDALVSRKNPMDFARRLSLYRKAGNSLFYE